MGKKDIYNNKKKPMNIIVTLPKQIYRGAIWCQILGSLKKFFFTKKL